METKQTTTEEVGPPTARSSPGGGSFASRRQKNLHKFRRHIAAQRHTHLTTSTPASPEPQSTKELSVADVSDKKSVKDAEPKDEKKASKNISQKEPETCVASKTTTNNDTTSKLHTPPSSPVMERKINSPKDTMTSPSRVGELDVSVTAAQSPHSGKRRSEIIKKLARKNRGVSAETPSINEEPLDPMAFDAEASDSSDLAVTRSISREENLNRIASVMTDSTNSTATISAKVDVSNSSSSHNNNIINSATNNNETNKSQDIYEVRKVKKIEIKDGSVAECILSTKSNSIPSVCEDDEKKENGEFGTCALTGLSSSSQYILDDEPSDPATNAEETEAANDGNDANGDEQDGIKAINVDPATNVDKTEAARLGDDATEDEQNGIVDMGFEETTMEVETATDHQQKINECDQTEATDTEPCESADIREISNSFDLRSIHEFPPEPVKAADAAMPSQDPSWDTSKVIFNEFQGPASSKGKKSDSLNMFDTAETAATESVSFSQAFESNTIFFSEDDNETFSACTIEANGVFIVGTFYSEVLEEKKELDSPASDHGIEAVASNGILEQAGSQESNLSPRRRLSRMQVNNGTPTAFGFDVANLAMDSTDELDRPRDMSDDTDTGSDNPSSEILREKDDEDLLGDKAATDEGDHHKQLWKNDSQLSKQERLLQYTSNLDEGDNSSTSSVKEEGEDDESSNEEIPEVVYMSHPGEEEEEEEGPEIPTAGADFEKMPIEIVDHAPTFSVALENAISVVVTAQTEKVPNENVDNAPTLSVTPENATSLAVHTAQTTSEIPSVVGTGHSFGSVSSSSSADSATAQKTTPMTQQTVGAIQSISASSTEGSGECASGPDKDQIGRADVPAGYISNSSSSSSSSASSTLGGKEESNCTKLQEESGFGEGVLNENEVLESSDTACSNIDGTNQNTADENASCAESAELQEAHSLVGVTLVPSFGQNSSRTSSPAPSSSTATAKSRTGSNLGIPPRGSLSPLFIPPPPPPPLSKRKKKKKRKSSSKQTVPLIAPPPEEKLKKWEESKKKATVQFKNVDLLKSENTNGDHVGAPDSTGREQIEAPISAVRALRRPPNVHDIDCKPLVEREPWQEPAESPGRIQIMACGDFPQQPLWAYGKEKDCGGIIFAMAGLAVSPPKDTNGAQAGATLSPVDAARSFAVENAMRRANEGASRLSVSPTSSGAKRATQSLFENEAVRSASLVASSGSSDEKSAEPDQADLEDGEKAYVAEPPELRRKNLDGSSHDGVDGQPTSFLDKLISPSFSMSPTNNNAANDSTPSHFSKPQSTSPIISDFKMAEKVAFASYAAAMTFEEQYTRATSSSDENTKVQSYETRNFDNNDPITFSEGKDIPSFFCAPELGHNFPTGDEATKDFPSLFFGPDAQSKFEKDITSLIEKKSEKLIDLVVGNTSSSMRNSHEDIQDLKGGAFSPWKNAIYANKGDWGKTGHSSSAISSQASTVTSSKDTIDKLTTLSSTDEEPHSSSVRILKAYEWLTQEVLKITNQETTPGLSNDTISQELAKLLDNDDNLNILCQIAADKVNEKIEQENEERAQRHAQLSPRKKMKPFFLGHLSGQKSSSVVAANFVSFMHRISKASGIPSPFGEDNPFLLDLVGTSLQGTPRAKSEDNGTMQTIVLGQCPADKLVIFIAQVCGVSLPDENIPMGRSVELKGSSESSVDLIEASRAANPSPTKKSRGEFFGGGLESHNFVSEEHPSPFESAMKQSPEILITILGCLGDAVTVCRMKMANQVCRDYIAQNEQRLMRDAVRLGGLSMNLRPSFWLWITLEKCSKQTPIKANDGAACGSEEKFDTKDSERELLSLEEAGRTGKWHNVIQRDVTRAFGNMPPHKTGARLRTDSIVRALVTWGRNRIMKRGVKGDGNPPPCVGQRQPSLDIDSSESDASQTPTDTVSDWGGVSPVASFTGSFNGVTDGDDRNSSRNDDGKGGTSRRSQDSQSVEADLLVLSGNALTDEMKADLQDKLAFILHALAATHDDVGYCQGMDYVVAHLLRILQDTVRWQAAHGTLPASIRSAPKLHMDLCDGDTDSFTQYVDEVDKSRVVEETVFRVMDCLFTSYNLQHMYWPELRCLKTCCRVFERLIQLKLPVLADHFDHHELNVGLFALGWFQTLFLYLPSMPSATVCHMWDIWLVERSFKIFFRVGTAILFLSQPILLNHELEGMMTYLNTFPDATLLNPDILIACALQIKVTNKMLMEIEAELCGSC